MKLKLHCFMVLSIFILQSVTAQYNYLKIPETPIRQYI